MYDSAADPKDGNIDINPTDIVRSPTRIHHFSCVSFTSDGEKLIADTSSGDFMILIIITLMLESITLTLTCSNQIRSLLDTPSGQVLLIGNDGSLTLFRQQVSRRKDWIKRKVGSGFALRYAVTSITNSAN
ncbi:MAG: hypothetical protein EZS28_026478 [Streblomastix strix]|uniref:Anaphase-promoting complex subunit 4 WD40 domain-containing protein n=1 Tax=Streblomastix strix TaxID=222440 RepID=A0A5J4V6G1_9EUKA|nr:MAG: hypothetical protein EZS28_026478 [Streblomastix strix]